MHRSLATVIPHLVSLLLVASVIGQWAIIPCLQGAGSAIVIVDFGSRRAIIIDAGGAGKHSLVAALPSATDLHSFDDVVLLSTHPDADHYRGFVPLVESGALEHCRTITIVSNPNATPQLADLVRAHSSPKASVQLLPFSRKTGVIPMQVAALVGTNVDLLVYSPDSLSARSNDNCLLARAQLRLGSTSTTLLDTSDASPLFSQYVQSYCGRTDFITGFHHGSRHCLPVAPSIIDSVTGGVVFQNGKANPYLHPNHLALGVVLARNDLRLHVTGNDGACMIGPNQGLTLLPKACTEAIGPLDSLLHCAPTTKAWAAREASLLSSEWSTIEQDLRSLRSLCCLLQVCPARSEPDMRKMLLDQVADLLMERHRECRDLVPKLRQWLKEKFGADVLREPLLKAYLNRRSYCPHPAVELLLPSDFPVEMHADREMASLTSACIAGPRHSYLGCQVRQAMELQSPALSYMAERTLQTLRTCDWAVRTFR